MTGKCTKYYWSITLWQRFSEERWISKDSQSIIQQWWQPKSWQLGRYVASYLQLLFTSDSTSCQGLFSFLFFFCDPCRQLSLLIIPVIQPQENSPILYEPFGTIRGQLVPGAALTNTPVYKELQLRTRTSSKSKACANASPAVDNQPFPKRGAN